MDHTPDAAKNSDSQTPTVSFAEAIRFWTKLGFISFGGPAGQIGIMQTELVDRLRWIGQAEFLRGLNFAMLLPGPEAQQLAAYLGWRMHGLRGAIFAGLSFIVPGMILILALAWVAATHGENKYVAAMFFGIKPIVVAIVALFGVMQYSKTPRLPPINCDTDAVADAVDVHVTHFVHLADGAVKRIDEVLDVVVVIGPVFLDDGHIR